MHRVTYLRHRTVGFNMTPMIDVVFLLIIFFLVSSHLAQRENRIEVSLPDAASGQRDVPTPNPRLTLTVQADGKIWLSGKPTDLKQLDSYLEARREQLGDDLEVRIRCDRTVPYRTVEPLLASAARAQIWNVIFAVVSDEES